MQQDDPSNLPGEMPEVTDDSSDSQTRSSTDDCPDTADPCQHYVVGVGASAGGLEALEDLFKALPADSGLAYVVVQHLSPDFKSHMDELLRRVTKLKVQVVENGIEVEPDTIYLIPPNAEMVISNGKLLLTERSAERGLSHPIDQFFRSLAQDCQRYAIGIVLSGTGSDGSRGITEIANHGGLVLAQDPASCKFDAMPLNAQETGNVHLVLPADAMATAIAQYVSEGTTPEVLREQQIGQLEETGLNRVFQLLQAAHEIDFSHYKPGTVERRIQRRMELLKLDDLNSYIERLSTDGVEVNELYKDLLIGVTRFFRDTEAFEFLQRNVLPRLIEKYRGELRVWVCGCATGEEAYSMAISLIEAYDRAGKQPDFKMFATDAHKESLQVASTGVYPQEKMGEVSEERRERFFRKRRDGFYITAEVRRHVVFAPHNVISDPPFTQMHLVTCRNLLIYLQPAAQRKALSMFHFALRRGGVLFMGPSETPGEISDEFEPLQKSWRIFRKRRDIRLPVDMRMPMGQRTELRGLHSVNSVPAAQPQSSDVLPALYDIVLGDVMPPSVLIDTQFHLLHAFPGSEEYMRFVLGRPTTNVLEIVYPEIKNSVAAAVQHALRDMQPVRYSGMPHPKDRSKQFRLVVRPYRPGSSQQCYLLLQFEPMDGEPRPVQQNAYEDVDLNEVATTRIEALEQDLSYTQQNLQATIEELETSNEELQATNEEMVAANEELQSTNEELHSVNEELYTVNAEHQKRVKELDEAHADMNNLLATTRVGVLFLDRDFYVRRFTPAMGQLLFMEPHDVGRHIEGFLSRLDDPSFLERLGEVLETRSEREWEAGCDDGTYLVRAMPYWTGSEVAGVVISFVNIDSIKRAEDQLARFKFMADCSIDAQILVDEDASIVYANDQAAKSLGYSNREMRSLTVMRIDAEHGNMADFQEKFKIARREGGALFESTHVRKDGTTFPVEVAITFVEFDDEPHLFATVRDITARRQAESTRWLLERAIGAVQNGIVISDPHQNDNPITFVNSGFTKMTGYASEEVIGQNCRFLQGEESDAKSVVAIRDGIRSRQPTRVLLRNYRKDGQPFWNDVYVTPVYDNHDELLAFVGVQNDVTERIEANEQVKHSERTIRLLLDSTAEGIYGVDMEGRCTFCNQSALRLLGYDSSDQLVGQDMHDLVHHHRADGSEYRKDDCPIFQTFRSGKPRHSEEEVFWRADGTSFPVEYWSHPLMEDGKCTGAVLTFVDTTQRRRELAEIQQARESADAANSAKSRFLANMSHELRTPLSAMLGFAEIMREGEESPETLQRLSTIQRNGEYLLRLVNDVLDLSRIEAGKFRTSRVSVQLDELLSDVEQTMHMRTEDNQAELKFHLKNPLPATVTTDPTRLRQVLINLIGNAIKFSPAGNVDVTVWSDRRDVDGQTETILTIEVKDDGIGMSDDQLNLLFQPFVQADPSIAARFGGTGLGLSITHRLIEALHGDIEVESCEGEGSCFQIRLPVDPVGDLVTVKLKQSGGIMAPASSETSTAEDAELQTLNVKVLVADDMRDVRYVAEHFLKKAGCQVDVAENGRQAIEMIKKAIDAGDPYRLVLMDVQMPEMGGEEAVRKLRDRGIDVPIIALTADAMKGTRRRLIAGGYDEYLSKPLDRRNLIRIARLLLH